MSITTTWRWVVAAAALTASLMVAAAPPTAAAASCASPWGSLPEHGADHTSATVRNLRAGRHACFDRLVIDLGPARSGLPGRQGEGFAVRYVDQVREARTGRPVALAGGARLEIIVHARALTDADVATYRPADPARAAAVGGFTTFRQVAFVGTQEAQTQIGLGVRARLPFRVFVLPGPGSGSRLVIDVAHRW
jgi:hypothetical protein